MGARQSEIERFQAIGAKEVRADALIVEITYLLSQLDRRDLPKVQAILEDKIAKAKARASDTEKSLKNGRSAL